MSQHAISTCDVESVFQRNPDFPARAQVALEEKLLLVGPGSKSRQKQALKIQDTRKTWATRTGANSRLKFITARKRRKTKEKIVPTTRWLNDLKRSE